MRAARKKSARASSRDVSYLDINQLELAVINRALRKRKIAKRLLFEGMGRSQRILLLQKRNLERLCRRLRRKCAETALENELESIVAGEKLLSARCMGPQ